MGGLLWRIGWWALKTVLITLYAPPWLKIALKILAWAVRLFHWLPVLTWWVRMISGPIRLWRWYKL